jgi:hypothetical protein
MSDRIENLRTAIETMHKCKATHEESVFVEERFRDQTVWEGVVESFALTGHPRAKRCYAWSYHDGEEIRYVHVLEIPPVTSPKTAVQAAIVSGNQK